MRSSHSNRSSHRGPDSQTGAIRGRGADDNPANRFERLHYEDCSAEDCSAESIGSSDAIDPSDDTSPGESASPRRGPDTLFLRDASRRVLSRNKSPDIPFAASLNPYRGCEHGCIYCYARPTHEYLGFSAGLDFETRILVKQDAPELLRKELSARSWRPQVIAMCGVTDPYQPIERRARITRGCLEVLAEFRNPVGLISKNSLVVRDLDILEELARFDCISVSLSITTLRSDLHRIMEPRASHPRQRLKAIERLSAAGIPVAVSLAPVIPGLTDHEIPSILDAARKAGARRAGMIMLRLPHGVSSLFENWLKQHFPDRAQRVLNQVRGMRGGELNDSNFGSRMRGEGVMADQIRDMFALYARRFGLTEASPELSLEHFRAPPSPQMELF